MIRKAMPLMPTPRSRRRCAPMNRRARYCPYPSVPLGYVKGGRDAQGFDPLASGTDPIDDPQSDPAAHGYPPQAPQKARAGRDQFKRGVMMSAVASMNREQLLEMQSRARTFQQRADDALAVRISGRRARFWARTLRVIAAIWP